MTTNDLFQAAVDAMRASGQRYGTARHTLANGDEIFCHVHTVAGCSITRKHSRTNYHRRLAADEYSKPISRAVVAELLRGSAS